MRDHARRLRTLNDALLTTGGDYSDVLLDAAGEIERLRAHVAELEAVIRQAANLLREVRAGHRDPGDAAYNECEQEECLFCVLAQKIEAAALESKL